MSHRAAGILLLISGLAIAAIAGCVMHHSAPVVPGRLGVFSHEEHVQNQGLPCQACHRKAAKGNEAGMPSIRQCELCHEENDESKPPEKRLTAFLVGGKVKWSSVTRMPEGLNFSHKVHIGAKIECESCHAGIKSSTRVTSALRPTMDTCISCHAKRDVGDTCNVCHTVISKNWAPPSHAHNWRMMHGQIVHAGPSDEMTERCSLCHEQSTCIKCHRDEPPQSHTNYWRRRGHAVQAGLDRTACATCHETDFCSRCHEHSAPLSHAGAWGAPRDVHCLNCHLASNTSGCFVCHHGTPSHLEATPKPSNHVDGMNCRQCHGLTAPLPHVDNGDECSACHH